MKFWVVLVAATLLVGGGAELDPPEGPPLARRIWGYLGLLGEAAENATVRLRGVPLIQKLQVLAQELGSQASALSGRLRAEASEARGRASEYGAEARTALEQSWGELKNRGAAYARKLRKRLHRDGEEFPAAVGRLRPGYRRRGGHAAAELGGRRGRGGGPRGTPSFGELRLVI
ncbi:apolipoprotein E-like [Morphnus guianensis]